MSVSGNDEREQYQRTGWKRRAHFKQEDCPLPNRFGNSRDILHSGAELARRHEQTKPLYQDRYVEGYNPNHSEESRTRRFNQYGHYPYDKDRRRGKSTTYGKYPMSINNNDDRTELERTLDKKTAFLIALSSSPPKKSLASNKISNQKSKDKDIQTQKSTNSQRLYVGNLFNPVENEDLERLLETYGPILEVRRYESHAIVTVCCSKEKAEEALKDLDHNNWMENWIRVKLDQFENTREEDWQEKLKKFSIRERPSHAKYSHCDRANDEPSSTEGNMGVQYGKEMKSREGSQSAVKSKLIDIESKRSLSKFLKSIRHDHCVEVVESIVKSQAVGKKFEAGNTDSVIPGITVTDSREDPRNPVEYNESFVSEMDF